jgi:hypothetical protein
MGSLFGPVGIVKRAAAGIGAAIRARPKLFMALVLAVFTFDLFLPPLVLSLARKPVDFFTFNPWLSRAPAYLVSGPAPLGERLAFLLRVALFWFSSDSPYGGVEWGYAVDATDLMRFLLMAVLVAVYFSLWLYRRDQRAAGWRMRLGRDGGALGAVASVLGLSTGPCSVMGCGAPVIPVLGLAFAGLSSGTLTLMTRLSTVGTAVVLTGMALGVVALGWIVGTDDRRSSGILDPSGTGTG